MIVDEKTVKKVAEVARLKLSEDELKKFSKDLNNILDAFKELDKVKTDGIQPTFWPIEVKDVLREDKVSESLEEKEALKNVKENKEDGYFKGPKVV